MTAGWAPNAAVFSLWRHFPFLRKHFMVPRDFGIDD
jgi:hypothetical protein